MNTQELADALGKTMAELANMPSEEFCRLVEEHAENPQHFQTRDFAYSDQEKEEEPHVHSMEFLRNT